MIGESHPRLGGERLVTGAGRFVEDVRVPGMLHAAVLRSPHAHARLVSLDAKRARDLPGVRLVLTAADVPAAAVIPNRVPAPAGADRYLQPAIARDVVRYVGEPVALVVADDAYTALDALELIDVAYDVLPACPSVAAATAPGAPRLFPGTESNNVATITMRVGDADAALAQAAVVLRERFRYPRQTAAALETRGLVAVPPDPRGGELHLIGSTKCIHINRTILAPIFGIPLGALRLTEVDVGGGFGVRGELYPEDILVPLAAIKLGRPVRWIESRRENLMAANHAREVGYDIEIGFDAEGRILAVRTTIRADIGAYVRTAALVPAEFGAALLPGPYRVPNYACDLWSVVTNKTPAGTLRSPGRPECNFVRERLLDAGAARLGLDPAELRRRNLIAAGEMPYDCGTKSFGVNTVYDSGDFPALFEELLRRLDYPRERAEQATLNARAGGLRRGIGLAVYVEKTGLGPFETTHVEALSNGRLVVDTGASSMGPGLETVLAQILGEALGLPANHFDVRHADTAAVESGVGTYGSRGTITAGNAAHLAAQKLIVEATARAAVRLGVPEAEVTYARGVLAAGGQRVTLADLAAERRLAAGASFEVKKLTYAGCACAAVADVDPETGVTTLRRVVVGADVGRAVNPALVDAQLVGGVAFGIGNTFGESLEYDAQGQLLSGTLMDYALPYATDVPPVEGFYQEVRATTNPLGLRGLGECGNPGMGAAIANAVCDALGARDAPLTALPVTPARVRELALRGR
ncbi:MAG TPA: xanthine dehydrogenase family protein molybdopterin-binding subunit [Methylomirabilota bacterium]|jgi:carbon-monoxide dehydrogenase large subunit|nr:xanthine dehydrogenase family protein molybdopterin-binding subunit [Methylomirabilota bacterium]